jgi:hypothetical protein
MSTKSVIKPTAANKIPSVVTTTPTSTAVGGAWKDMINKNSNSEVGIVKKDENINKINAQLAKKRAHEEINKTISEDGN